jgi:type VII secretion-associated serine protease mycosin
MSRIAVTVLGLALIAAVQVPVPAVARSRAAQSPLALAAAEAPLSATAPLVVSEPGQSQDCPPGLGTSRVTAEPWAQRALGFSSAWSETRGQGVTVAVVDSGVDDIPQLTGKVTSIDLTGTGTQDCVGHGTEVAAIIAASDMQAEGIPFAGVAPGARIFSVKVNSIDQGSATLLADGIIDAASSGAGVINVSITTSDSPVLRSAIAFALSRDAVIVAAGGNDQPGTSGPFYPASYPGVLSVGAVASNGALAPFSDQRSHVAVTAPGVDVTSAWPKGYQTQLNGTSYATAFVSGVAALVRSSHPTLTAGQVVRRIEATADGGTGPGTGAGLVNPLEAVTAVALPMGAPSASSVIPKAVSVPRPPRLGRGTRAAALAVTLGSLGAAALLALGAVVISQGRRRGWHAGRTSIPADGGVADDTWP